MRSLGATKSSFGTHESLELFFCVYNFFLLCHILLLAIILTHLYNLFCQSIQRMSHQVHLFQSNTLKPLFPSILGLLYKGVMEGLKEKISIDGERPVVISTLKTC